MLKSDACILSALSPAQLVARKEDAEETGGYFIVNGGERVVRMLVQQRRNFPVALERGTWKKHPNFTQFGVTARLLGVALGNETGTSKVGAISNAQKAQSLLNCKWGGTLCAF